MSTIVSPRMLWHIKDPVAGDPDAAKTHALIKTLCELARDDYLEDTSE